MNLYRVPTAGGASVIGCCPDAQGRYVRSLLLRIKGRLSWVAI
jgi:hypothetical protein